eukprot:TRINITY_DN27492_c0_g1_i7.p1 TRINITY_DN27492_c0_g1~~TRINITY_DN27492_c0_g1_i7.p1  ORF type:complete len:757 (-),score=220.18 TRINITY_DN27492_c0_g1_i7:108-2378(-)
MVSWLRGNSAKDWNAQLRETLRQAASSAQVLAEHTRAELQELGQQSAEFGETLRASTSTAVAHAAQADATSILDFADRFADTVTSIGDKLGLGDLVEDEEEPPPAQTAREVTKTFEAEARALQAAVATATEGGRRSIATVDKALRRWETRIVTGEDEQSGLAVPFAPPARPAADLSAVSSNAESLRTCRLISTLTSFLKSRALETTLAALARSNAYRSLLRVAFAAASAGEGAVLSDVDEKEVACGQLLVRLMCRAAFWSTPEFKVEKEKAALMGRVLALLADAADADAQEGVAACSKGGLDQTVCGAAAQNMQWVMVLVSSVLSDVREAELHAQSELEQALQAAVDSGAAAASIPDAASLEKAAEAGDQASAEAWRRHLFAVDAQSTAIARLTQLLALAGQSRSRNAQASADGAAVAERPLPLPELAATATSLECLRNQGEYRVESLGKAREGCAADEEALQERMRSGSSSWRDELAVIKEKQGQAKDLMSKLQAEREELLKQLQAKDDEISWAKQAQDELTEAEQKIEEGAKNSSEAVVKELSVCEAKSRSLAAQQSVVESASKVSIEVENLLRLRAQEAEAASSRSGRVQATAVNLARTRVEAERCRQKGLSELLAAWTAALWGPGADALSKNSQMVRVLRVAHQQAASAVEKAWREASQFASSPATASVAQTGTLADDMSHIAWRYKSLLLDIEKNLQRLSKYEAAVKAATHTPVLAQATAPAASGDGPAGPAGPPLSSLADDPNIADDAAE